MGSTISRITIVALLGLVLPLTACKKSGEPETPEQPSTTAPQPEEPEDEPEEPAEKTKADAGAADSADAAVKIVSGEAIYGHVCVTCHGKTGDGKGLEQQLFSYGAPESKWTNGPTVEGIMKTLQTGVHESSMKPFPQYKKAERRAVAQYVLGLREKLQKEQKTE
jgi:mono/diheme cytochrome c family protein